MEHVVGFTFFGFLWPLLVTNSAWLFFQHDVCSCLLCPMIFFFNSWQCGFDLETVTSYYTCLMLSAQVLSMV